MYGYQLGDTADPDSVDYQGDATFAPTRIISSEERAQSDALIAAYRARQAELQTSTTSPYTVAGPTLTPLGKEFQRMTLARDWDALFTFLPPIWWGQYGIFGKYSFVDSAQGRQYIPFSENDIKRFVYSPYYTVQPGHVCTDEQLQMGVAALWKATQTHKAKFPATDWRHIWPIYPGWGYPGQRFGCEKYVPSTWVKIREPVVAAAVIVAAVYLGPLIADKIAGAATGTQTSGIVGAGTKAGALTSTVTTKAGAAAISLKAGAITAVESASFFQTVQSGTTSLLKYVNKARTIDAIANGEIPPPPISIVGDSFTDWAMIIAKEQIAQEAQERAMQMGADYVQRELTKKEEAKLRAEIQAMQLELSRMIPANTPASPDRQVPSLVQQASAELAMRDKQAQDSLLLAMAIALPVGLALL